MYKHVLIATDGSEHSLKAVEQGVALAKALGAKVTFVTVTEAWHTLAMGETTVAFPIDEYESTAARSAEAVLANARKVAVDAGVTAETEYVKDSYPADGILKVAKDKGCDLIAMASHGRRGFARLLLGSQANHVVTHSTLPVLIYR